MAKRQKLDAVALLKADHRKVEELFEQFRSARDKSHKTALAKEICTELCVHTMIEEEIFYPACTGQVGDNTIDEAYVEHDGAKVLVAELLNGDPDNEFYDAKMKVLSEEIRHHVKEEEKRTEGLFAQAKAAGVDLDELGDRLMARKAEALARIKQEGLPPLQTRSFTGHELRQAGPVDGGTAAHHGD